MNLILKFICTKCSYSKIVCLTGSEQEDKDKIDQTVVASMELSKISPETGNSFFKLLNYGLKYYRLE